MNDLFIFGFGVFVTILCIGPLVLAAVLDEKSRDDLEQ